MSHSDVTVVDYGLGNLFNVKRAFENVGAQNVLITSNPDEILNAKRLVLPGVGAFAEGMDGLKSRNLVAALRAFATTDKPFLGICLGMQLMMEQSEELGVTEGLGIIPGKVTQMKPGTGEDLKIPQIGWNELKASRSDSVIAGMKGPITLYFLHSFVAVPRDPQLVLAKTDYGSVEFVSAVQKGSLVGFQPHLERSGPQGLAILKNFLKQGQ